MPAIITDTFDYDDIVRVLDLDAYSGDSRSPIPMISVHSVGERLSPEYAVKLS